ncbi:MAG: phosphotransferase [Fluviicola sp.]
MHSVLEQQVLLHTQADSISKIERVQSLWSDFGSLERVWLNGCNMESIIIKRIAPPTKMHHPNGWNTDASAQRKLKSYQVECYWYEHYAKKLNDGLRVPRFLFSFEAGGTIILGMEDLLCSGFIQSYNTSQNCFDRCLEWLAKFHAFHLNVEPEGLWKVGTYWHLDTRQEEWEAMKDEDLKGAASQIDSVLNQCKYQTLVHGDAKPANFCFTADFSQVAAVDFQYVGRGCGLKDVIYLMSSTLSEGELFREDQNIIKKYFRFFEKYLRLYSISNVNFDTLKSEWQGLYSLVWSDFDRFLSSWNPSSKRVNGYMSMQSKKALMQLNEDVE